MFSEGGNSNTSMVWAYLNSRTQPCSFRGCESVKSTNIESLPDELLFDILVLLPADYLYDRARLVCRRWYNIIHSHDFINTQLQHSTYGLLIAPDPVGSSVHPLFVSATTQGRIDMSEFSYKCKTRLPGSCNGLGLEFHIDYNIPYIINPATKQVFVLPSFPSEHCKGFRSGIAYAAATMEYKVTLLIDDPRQVPIFLAILTVGVDNSWRYLPVEIIDLHTRYLLRPTPLLNEGFMHWTDSSTLVLTLDVETEVFTISEVPLGKRCKTKRKYYLSTGRYLTLLVARRDFSWQVWLMEPESQKWQRRLPNINLEAQRCRLKQFSGGGGNQILVPLGWVKYPEVLAMYFQSCTCTCTCIFFYNLDTHEISSTKSHDPFRAPHAFVHKNNLAWLT